MNDYPKIEIPDSFKQINLIRALILSLCLIAIGTAVLWDHYRVNRDFAQLKTLLINTRLSSAEDDRSLIVRFINKAVRVIEMETGAVSRNLEVPTLHSVNYDSTIGKDTIVFTPIGTSSYNVRVHGGDMTLKSWFGFKKNISVNCTGLVMEGLYPNDQKNHIRWSNRS